MVRKAVLLITIMGTLFNGLFVTGAAASFLPVPATFPAAVTSDHSIPAQCAVPAMRVDAMVNGATPLTEGFRDAGTEREQASGDMIALAHFTERPVMRNAAVPGISCAAAVDAACFRSEALPVRRPPGWAAASYIHSYIVSLSRGNLPPAAGIFCAGTPNPTAQRAAGFFIL